MTSLQRHIPELALEWAHDTPDELWRQIDGTLCFADISGFTALAERLAQRGRMGGERGRGDASGFTQRRRDPNLGGAIAADHVRWAALGGGGLFAGRQSIERK
jgi:hypothetical protein